MPNLVLKRSGGSYSDGPTKKYVPGKVYSVSDKDAARLLATGHFVQTGAAAPAEAKESKEPEAPEAAGDADASKKGSKKAK